jgi:pSer/pThr/pTyr-binding forkhead associated (FHA) protein
VSRRHAAIHQIDDGLAIEDLGSKNGTFVNERRVSGIVPVAPGDRIRFGNTVWRLEPVAPASGGEGDRRAAAGDAAAGGVTD